MELLFLSLLHFYINQFLLFLISWCLRFHYISVLWSITATKNYKITNKIKIYFQKTKGFIKLSFNVIQFQSFVNSATETESLARIVSFKDKMHRNIFWKVSTFCGSTLIDKSNLLQNLTHIGKKIWCQLKICISKFWEGNFLEILLMTFLQNKLAGGPVGWEGKGIALCDAVMDI